jgi:putative hydrolase of the HAD superfamily
MIRAVPKPLDRQTLIFDADDTLWENNVIFERVIDDFVEWIAHPTLEPSAVRAILTEIEDANIVAHGYGSQVFLRSLAECFTRLRQRPLGDAEKAQMAQFTAAFTSGQVELIPAVTDVLDELGTRHDLYLMTKGVPEEQQRKIDASGLAKHFNGVDIVATKDPETYLRVVTNRALDHGRTWMIGNSPKSDIVPARRAGLNAVYIPNESTWVLEHDVVDPADERVLHLTRFPDLLAHF